MTFFADYKFSRFLTGSLIVFVMCSITTYAQANVIIVHLVKIHHHVLEDWLPEQDYIPNIEKLLLDVSYVCGFCFTKQIKLARIDHNVLTEKNCWTGVVGFNSSPQYRAMVQVFNFLSKSVKRCRYCTKIFVNKDALSWFRDAMFLG